MNIHHTSAPSITPHHAYSGEKGIFDLESEQQFRPLTRRHQSSVKKSCSKLRAPKVKPHPSLSPKALHLSHGTQHHHKSGRTTMPAPPTSRPQQARRHKSLHFLQCLHECGADVSTFSKNFILEMNFMSPLPASPCPTSHIVIPSSRRVHFDLTKNETILIPSHRDVPALEKPFIWTGAKALKENAKRNEVEWEKEKYDWRNAVEEEDFLLCPRGFLWHPAHEQYVQECWNAHVPPLLKTSRKSIVGEILTITSWGSRKYSF